MQTNVLDSLLTISSMIDKIYKINNMDMYVAILGLAPLPIYWYIIKMSQLYGLRLLANVPHLLMKQILLLYLMLLLLMCMIVCLFLLLMTRRWASSLLVVC